MKQNGGRKGQITPEILSIKAPESFTRAIRRALIYALFRSKDSNISNVGNAFSYLSLHDTESPENKLGDLVDFKKRLSDTDGHDDH